MQNELSLNEAQTNGDKNSMKPLHDIYYGMLYYRIKDWWRKVKRDREHSAKFLKEQPEDREKISESNDRQSREDDRARAVQLLSILPERQQKVARMYYLDDLSTEEIAQQLNTPVGNVYYDLFQGRKTLRDAF